MNSINRRLFSSVDASGLAFIRISYALIMLWEIERYFERDWIFQYWIEPVFYFTYQGFEWVKPWPGNGMIIHFYVLAFLAFLILLGLFYRIAMLLMFLGFTYVFLLEKAYYLNHFYLVSLVSFLMIFIPAHKTFSVDALLWKKLSVRTIPAWSVMLIQFQIGLVYVYGALAKVNYDWLVLAQPMHSWLSEKTDFPLLGRFFIHHEIAFFMSWSGMLLDLLAPFLLGMRRTRPWMYAVILAFHFINDRLFQIGIFPWFMILFSTIFFPAEWPKRFLRVVKENQKNQGAIIITGALFFAFVQIYFHRSFEIIPFLIGAASGAILIWIFVDSFAKPAIGKPGFYPAFPYKRFIVVLLLIWMLAQAAIPLRHYFIRGDASWTEEGHRFAWRMMLRQKFGRVKFFAYDPVTESSFELNQNLTLRQADKMVTRPHMIIQYAKYLKDDLKNRDIESQGMRKDHIDRYKIRVEAFANLNCRIYMRLIDPNVDLSKQTYSDFRHNSWILTQEEDLAGFMPEENCGIWVEE